MVTVEVVSAVTARLKSVLILIAGDSLVLIKTMNLNTLISLLAVLL